ncbi:hypothetical protein BJ508DRAFT_365454 [Ascobolus immersus RN42]|uniref:Uncharacterized protein n=1 Tax=Ascobolus immersus RN42 TaxID=1160509 RepID=A0A3N4HS24_ASCIM|nr:hypothetical protein BJ508DRAFT_365454 [Ascobolus immersus RN42]
MELDSDTQLVDGSEVEWDEEAVVPPMMEGEEEALDSSTMEGDDESVDSSMMEGDEEPLDSSTMEGDDESADSSMMEGDDESVDSSMMESDDESMDSSAVDSIDPNELLPFDFSLATLDTTVLSPSVHEEVLAFLKFLPKEHTMIDSHLNYSYDDHRPDKFFLLYLNLCGLKYQMNEGPVRDLKGLYPAPLLMVLEEYMLFYIRKLHPYFVRLGRPVNLKDYWADDGPFDPRRFYVTSAYNFGCPLDRGSWPVPHRWRAGLMREKQIRLVTTVARNLFIELSELLEIKTDDEKTRTVEFSRVCIRAESTLSKFLANSQFRSERLENLLCKYLDEEEVNWELVRKLDLIWREDEAIKYSEYLHSGWFDD